MNSSLTRSSASDRSVLTRSHVWCLPLYSKLIISSPSCIIAGRSLYALHFDHCVFYPRPTCIISVSSFIPCFDRRRLCLGCPLPQRRLHIVVLLLVVFPLACSSSTVLLLIIIAPSRLPCRSLLNYPFSEPSTCLDHLCLVYSLYD